MHVFTYGSLMFAPVWQRVVAGSYSSVDARLDDFRRHACLHASYPMVRPKPGYCVQGRLYRNVSADDLARLDRFEGDEYQRQTLEVATTTGTTEIAGVYVAKPHCLDRLSDQDWDPQLFEHDHLPAFIADYSGFGEL